MSDDEKPYPILERYEVKLNHIIDLCIEMKKYINEMRTHE